MKKLFSLLIGIFALTALISPNALAAEEKPVPKTTITDRFKIELDTNFDKSTKNLKLTFSNILLLKELKYHVDYKVENKSQTIYGDIKPYTNEDIERNLKLGDCSKEACIYSGEISNIEIEYAAEYYFIGNENITLKP